MSGVELPHLWMFDPTHQAEICALERTPSRIRIRSTWPSAERSSMPIRSAISLFVRPLLTRSATSFCLLVNVGVALLRRAFKPRKRRISLISESTSPT